MAIATRHPGSKEDNIRHLSEARAKKERAKIEKDLREVRSTLMLELATPRTNPSGRPVRLRALETATGLWKSASLSLDRLEPQERSDFERLSLILLEKYLLSNNEGNIRAAEGFIQAVKIPDALDRVIELELLERDNMVGAITIYKALPSSISRQNLKETAFRFLMKTKDDAMRRPGYSEEHMHEVEAYLLNSFRLNRIEYEKYAKEHLQRDLPL